jgi:hypothetical protein
LKAEALPKIGYYTRRLIGEAPSICLRFAFFDMKIWAFKHPSYITSLVILVIIALVLINLPLRKAGNPDEPAPPVASH